MSHHDEEHARALLQAAAETIDVHPVPVDPPGPRAPSRPALAAAAAVLVVLGLVTAVVALHRQDGSPGPAPAPRSAVEVPPVSTLPADRAEERLRALGLHVRPTTTPLGVECERQRGRAVTTVPPVGTRLQPGATVELVTTVPSLPSASGPLAASSAFCVPPYGEELVHDLLDLARGYDAGPLFAPTVALWVDGEHVRTLPADEATNAGAWGAESALTRLVDDAERTVRMEDVVVAAVPSVRHRRQDASTCAGAMPGTLAGRPSDVVRIEVPSDGVSLVCHEVHVFRDDAGRVDAVLSSATPEPAEPAEDEDVPTGADGHGRRLADARVAAVNVLLGGS